MTELVLIRGGGDLASGVALRLRRSGYRVVVAELPEPLAVRRTVAFAEALRLGEIRIEDRLGRRTELHQVQGVLRRGEVPVVIDPGAELVLREDFAAVVDARMLKVPPSPLPRTVPFLVGLGPGFAAGLNCDAVVETKRGHMMGRVYWTGPADADSGIPEGDGRRVLRAPASGTLRPHTEIGAHVADGQLIAEVLPPAETPAAPHEIRGAMAGVVRGLLPEGAAVQAGLKIGDIDPRDDPRFCFLVSDKALAVAGGVLEALLSRGTRARPGL